MSVVQLLGIFQTFVYNIEKDSLIVPPPERLWVLYTNYADAPSIPNMILLYES